MIEKKVVARHGACLTHRLEEFADAAIVCKYQTWDCPHCKPKTVRYTLAR
ncbi:hypothetical protein J4211_00300 [Candidatus Woesearchaeota archaeon]|nr:hypothetical protein [Candidatus Woesearchaeota archaeon]